MISVTLINLPVSLSSWRKNGIISTRLGEDERSTGKEGADADRIVPASGSHQRRLLTQKANRHHIEYKHTQRSYWRFLSHSIRERRKGNENDRRKRDLTF
jgi:hypothetical protein